MKWSRALQAIGFIVLLIGISAFLLQAFPSVLGADHSFIVMSGSMEPTIPTGSVIFVQSVSAEQVHEGDVITFSKGSGAVPTTHRVIEKHQAQDSLRFETQGDANEDPDPQPVYRPDLVGKVMSLEVPLLGGTLLVIPYIGYVVAFAQTRMGYVAMVLVPVMLLIFSELWSLYRAMEPAEQEQ